MELSIPFIVVCGLTILVVILGLVHWGLFKITHWGMLEGIPETKVSWMLQSVKEAQISPPSQLSSPKSDSTASKHNRLDRESKNVKEMLQHATFSWREDKGIRRSSGRIQVNKHPVTHLLLSSPLVQALPEITPDTKTEVQPSVSELKNAEKGTNIKSGML